ncbi:MAG: hypothetical protein ACK40G_10585 [Cytophagaceae bacterium]
MEENFKIIEVKPGTADFDMFLQVPFNIYSDHSIRLKQAENINYEFLQSAWVAFRFDVPVGRVALYNNPYLSYNGFPAVCVGNFECLNEQPMASALLSKSVEYVARLGKEYIIGPMNGSTWYDYRFSDHNDQPQFLMEPKHPVFYNDLFSGFGFEPIAKYYSSIDRNLNTADEGTDKKMEEFIRSGLLLRNINLSDYENELQKIYDFSMRVFRNNFLFTPISKEQFFEKYKYIDKMINPEYVLIAEDKSGNMKGLTFCIHDYYYTTSKCLIIKTMARDLSEEYKGLGNCMVNEVIKRAKVNGYESLIHAFYIKEGSSEKLSVNYKGEYYKSYTLYGLKL